MLPSSPTRPLKSCSGALGGKSENETVKRSPTWTMVAPTAVTDGGGATGPTALGGGLTTGGVTGTPVAMGTGGTETGTGATAGVTGGGSAGGLTKTGGATG